MTGYEPTLSGLQHRLEYLMERAAEWVDRRASTMRTRSAFG
jgi:hypothetical protein